MESRMLLTLASMLIFAGGARAESRSRGGNDSGCTVSMSPDLASPQLVAAAVRWTATASAECGDQPVFKFSVSNGRDRDALMMLRDFSHRSWFVWNPLRAGGHYRIRVEVKSGFDLGLPTSSATSEPYSIASPWNHGAHPVIRSTTHPLVVLYSTPPCNQLLEDSRSIAVAYRSPEGATARTAWFPCNGRQANDILVSGLRTRTLYALQTLLMDDDGRVITLPGEHSYTTDPLPDNLTIPEGRIIKPVDSNTNTEYPFLWVAVINNPTSGLALDLAGRPVWYWDISSHAPELSAPGSIRLTHSTAFLNTRDAFSPPPSDHLAQTVFREVNLTGQPRFETNVDAVTAQTSSDPDGFSVIGFHHDAVRLDDGYTVLIGYTTRTITVCDAECHSQNYLSDVLVALDDNGQVRWKWNAFDHFDPLRPPPTNYPVCYNPGLGDLCPPGETCVPLSGECPIRGAKDFTHSNSINPALGARTNLLLSVRHQDWVAKINFADATGDGAILWKFGDEGDFNLTSGTWQSHQHFAFFTDDGLLALFDNGNRRCFPFTELTCPFPSRGRAWALDQDAFTAIPVVDIPLGPEGTAPTIYSMAVGSAERLDNANWVFDAGFTLFAPEDPSCPAPDHRCGQIQEWANVEGAWVQTFTYQFNTRIYRGLRFKDLYTGFTPQGSH